MALEWPWSYHGQSTLESGGDALKTGRMTGALLQCPQSCPYVPRIALIKSQPLSGRDLFSAIRGGKPPNSVLFQHSLKSFNHC